MLTPHCWAKALGGKIIRDKYLLQLAAREREKAAKSQGRTRRGKGRAHISSVSCLMVLKKMTREMRLWVQVLI